MSGPDNRRASTVSGTGRSGGPFHRKPADKRLVKTITSHAYQPPHWMPMDLSEVECKIMEIRKYSADYYDLDTKFRKPNLQMITAYNVQNPFLYGCFSLRKEQMNMQLAKKPALGAAAATGGGGKGSGGGSGSDGGAVSAGSTVKERNLYFPTNFAGLELIVRNNFSSANALRHGSSSTSGGGGGGFSRRGRETGMRFYATSADANAAMKDDSNPRVMVVARVLVGVCETLSDLNLDNSGHRHHHRRHHHLPDLLPYFSKGGRCVDTLASEDGAVVVKTNANEVYPDQILVYRDKSGDGDQRTSRLTNVMKYCQLSYRAGTRFNPEEVTFKGRKAPKDSVAAAAAAAQHKQEGDGDGVITEQPSSSSVVQIERETTTAAAVAAGPKKKVSLSLPPPPHTYGQEDSEKWRKDSGKEGGGGEPEGSGGGQQRRRRKHGATAGESIEMSPMSMSPDEEEEG